ncbi:hypothetical protein C818_04203 [Lachnospiraceae bacterium MD308]|nr:hypothetical protein C818_04203 [Lachnospiraceae bacterium MD308]
MECSKTYAVDFDKTLNLAEKYPQLGEPNMRLIGYLSARQQAGDKIILWTCREGDLLNSAVKFCKRYGLEFDAVNDNLRENIEHFNHNSRKVCADYYIDDRNMGFWNLPLTAPPKLQVEERMGIAEYIMRRLAKTE